MLVHAVEKSTATLYGPAVRCKLRDAANDGTGRSAVDICFGRRPSSAAESRPYLICEIAFRHPLRDLHCDEDGLFMEYLGNCRNRPDQRSTDRETEH
jgi:hypothetical protein